MVSLSFMTLYVSNYVEKWNYNKPMYLQKKYIYSD